jgi:pimeloyl-ACP methyl ester carboxylesterase
MPTFPLGTAEIAYSASGTGDAVLLVQGVGVAGSGWRPQIDALAGRFRTIAVDNRGIGGSSLGSEPLTIERMASDALAVMDREGIDRFHLVGHSMGGLIALRIALTARERIKSLSLLCTFADGKDGSRLSPQVFMLGLRTRIGTRSMRRNAMLDMVMPAAYLRTVDRERLAGELAGLFGRDLGEQPPIVMKQLRAMAAYSAAGSLQQLSGTPTLVVSAAHDPIARPPLGRALADGIADARYIEFPDAGHAVTIQCAKEINALLVEHLIGAASKAGASAGFAPLP